MVTAKTGGKSRPPMTDKELIKELRTLASFLSQQNTDLKKQIKDIKDDNKLCQCDDKESKYFISNWCNDCKKHIT